MKFAGHLTRKNSNGRNDKYGARLRRDSIGWLSSCVPHVLTSFEEEKRIIEIKQATP